MAMQTYAFMLRQLQQHANSFTRCTGAPEVSVILKCQ